MAPGALLPRSAEVGGRGGRRPWLWWGYRDTRILATLDEVVIRTALTATERLVWHGGDHTAQLESASCRRFRIARIRRFQRHVVVSRACPRSLQLGPPAAGCRWVGKTVHAPHTEFQGCAATRGSRPCYRTTRTHTLDVALRKTRTRAQTTGAQRARIVDVISSCFSAEEKLKWVVPVSHCGVKS